MKMRAKIQRRDIFKLSKEKSQSRIPYPTKISLKGKGKVTFETSKNKENSLPRVMYCKKFKRNSSGERKMRHDRNSDIHKGMKNDRNKKYMDEHELSLKTDRGKKKGKTQLPISRGKDKIRVHILYTTKRIKEGCRGDSVG